MFHTYWFAADRWGWSPDVVDRQSAVLLHDLEEIQLVVEEVRREQAEREA